MASYIVLARKWRPAQFSDIVGQGHIVRTLMNAIRSERIHQAYLFTGSRGIGKTSISRIFAKVIRCENSREVDGWLRSCDECSSCKEITSGNSVDVIEIDGASNNGVEAVREIRENAKYLPSTGKRKIYIIDEVHMLTTAAFNALLKTLEEPPAHVIFIFATTEPHKIPATILSRCQRFDYRRVTLAQIQTRLLEVTQAEGIKADPAALALISRAAEGSMRDALSLLDQVIAFAGVEISVQSVRESIGLIEGQTLLGILRGIFERKPIESLALIDQAWQRGHDLRVLTRGLIEFLHGALLARVGAPNSGMLEISEDEWKELKSIAEKREIEEIELIFQVLHHGLEWIARSPQPKVVLDVLVVKCATAEALTYAGSTGTSSGGGSVQAESPSPAKAPATTPRPVRMAPETSAPHAQTISAQTISAQLSAKKPAAEAPKELSEKTAEKTVTTPAQNAATSADNPAATAAPSGERSWEGFIEHVRKSRPLLASILEHGNSEGATSEGLMVCFRSEDAYYREQLQSRIYHEQMLNFCKEFFGRPMRIQVELREGGESLAAKRERERKDRETAARTAAQNHPIILEAKALFGGELGPIELTGDSEPEYANL